jgi:hypothetical protein
VINWKLALVPLLDTIKGHREPRVFKFQRADNDDTKSKVVTRVKLHMGAIKNEAYSPKDGWVIWKDDTRPNWESMTFLPKKKIDVDGLTKSLEFLKKKRYIPKDEYKQVEAFIKAKTEQNDNTCDKCMAFRAIQLTHRSSKNHTDVERIAHRRVKDQTNLDFNKHLFDDRKAHPIPTRKECWPVGCSDVINHKMPSPDDDDTDSDSEANDLKDDELVIDNIGKEVMSVGRVQYTQLKPLKIGYMVALYAHAKPYLEDFWVARVVGWDKNGGKKKLQVHWYGYKDNKEKKEDDRWYYRGERKKNSDKQETWVKPGGALAKGREWVEMISHDALLYWVPTTFLTVKGKVKVAPMKKIRARVDYVKNNLGHNRPD